MNKKSFNLGLAHIGVFVDNIKVSKKFYQDMLDMEIFHENIIKTPDGSILVAFVKKNDLVIELVQLPIPQKSKVEGPVHHIAFKVKNIEAARDELAAKGIVFIDAEISFKPHLFENGGKWIMFKGPDNEILELNEVL